jgi:hypothetical protein
MFVLNKLLYLQLYLPSCNLWPTFLLRKDKYCDGSTLLCPLISVPIAPSWAAMDMPLMFFACGQEKADGQGLIPCTKSCESWTRSTVLSVLRFATQLRLLLPKATSFKIRPSAVRLVLPRYSPEPERPARRIDTACCGRRRVFWTWFERSCQPR